MPITGKEIVVPEQKFSQYYLSDLRVVSGIPGTDAKQVLSATLVPYAVADGIVTTARERIRISVDDLVAYAQEHPSVAQAIALVLTEVEKVAREQDKI